jgi:anti-anti-sigma factor
MQGAIIAAHEGDADAAIKARELGVLLLRHEMGHAALADGEPAPIGRGGYLAADLVGPEPTLRLSGQLDAETAASVAAVIDERYDGRISLDLSGLEFVDVAGLRALRGTNARPIAIVAPSDAVRRLVGMLGWDSDPDVLVPPGA